MFYAYRGIGTGTGALVLFAAAQVPMALHGYRRGERTSVFGVLLAFGGLIAFLRPWKLSATLGPAALMALPGLAWGLYSLRGRATGRAVRWTADSFIYAVPLALAWLLPTASSIRQPRPVLRSLVRGHHIRLVLCPVVLGSQPAHRNRGWSHPTIGTGA